MNATRSNVVDIKVAACKKLLRAVGVNYKKTVPTFRDAIKDVITQEAMREYVTVPADIVKQAVEASNRIIDAGGTFMEAMEMVEAIVEDGRRQIEQPQLNIESLYNAERLAIFYRRRDRLTEAMIGLVNRHIRDRLQGHSDIDIHYAIVRARRVLDGGGTLGCALYHAIGHVLDGPQSA